MEPWSDDSHNKVWNRITVVKHRNHAQFNWSCWFGRKHNPNLFNEKLIGKSLLGHGLMP